MEPKVLTEEQYKTLSKELANTIEKRYKVIPLNTLKDPHYNLKKAVYITIEMDGDKVIASLDDIEAFAYADTEYEAVSRLCKEIVNIYEDLKIDEKNLDILPRQWLDYLEEIISNK